MTLQDFFKEHKKAALAFSGGVDSSYLLYAATECGAQIRPYFVKTAFQPLFELDDALRLAEETGADLKILNVDILSDDVVCSNPKDRCYYCKKAIFSAIIREAASDGYDLLIDGTNASDDADDRPGMKVLKEMSVLSPLRECGITKSEIRRLSGEAGLFTRDKPSYACLATRIPAGERITKEKLERTEIAENFMLSLGFTDFRVRFAGDAAKIQLPGRQFALLIEKREIILNELKKYYSDVVLDLEVRQSE